MPSRSVTLAIVLFWLGMSGWLFYREIWPRLQGSEPVPFRIDLEDEVGARSIFWEVWQNGNRIGFARTEIRRRPDRLYDFHSEFRLHGLRILVLHVRWLQGTYTITASGELRGLSFAVKVGGLVESEIKLEGPVEKGMFKPRLRLDRIEIKDNSLVKIEPVRVSGQGSILNPMHPLNRISGLRQGQRWKVPYVQPLAVASAPLGGTTTIGQLDAEVTADKIQWHDEQVDCWRIDYAESGKKVNARTWVRQADDVVLQQEAGYQGMSLVLIREKKK